MNTMPENLIQRILEFFQTQKIVKIDKTMTQHDINQKINKRRKLLINGIGIKTDIKSILNFSEVNKRFNQIIKSDIGKLILTVHYNSQNLILENILQHISYCHESDCQNICHYVNKDIKYSNIMKKIAVDKFRSLKHNEDLAEKFKFHLSIKQVGSYYKIKKMDKKLKNETSKSSES